jgi:hypothetical protein
MRNKIILIAALVSVGFLAGFLPWYVKGKRLESELRAARQENSLAQLRDLAGLVFLQASQNDYGQAAGTSTRLFNRTRDIADRTEDLGDKKRLADLLSLRDPITATLAKGDPGNLHDVQALFVATRQATENSSGAQFTKRKGPGE